MSSDASGAGVRTVVQCYSLFDKFFPTCGLLDYTEGIYHDDPNTPYEQAQQNQINYLLRRSPVPARRPHSGSRLWQWDALDEVRRRGRWGRDYDLAGAGQLCRAPRARRSSSDYRELESQSIGRFDAVIANGK